MKAGECFKQTEWIVENDKKLKKMVASAGGKLIGYNFSTIPQVNWASVGVRVNIDAPPGQGFEWGLLGTPPPNIRIFKVTFQQVQGWNHDWLISRVLHQPVPSIPGT